MYKLRSIVQRGLIMTAGLALVAATFIPPTPASADALNPLTDRSLTLSSSSPGWSNTDGSGNTKYAPPNSGANGGKTGNTFQFRVSTDTSTGSTNVKTMTFQYCTTSAGLCRAPGDDTTAGADTPSTSDLKVTYPSPAELSNSNFSTVVDTTTDANAGNVQAVPGYTNPADPTDTTGAYAASGITGNYVVYYLDSTTNTWTQSSGWTMSVANVENATAPTGNGTPVTTGQNNYIILTNTTGQGFSPSDIVKVVFFGTTDDYIQNPGSGAFYVKINTYSVPYSSAATPVAPAVGISGLEPASDTNVIDGGVTVANVMNQSIQITTKVLETMQFSVGTVDPDTLSSTGGAGNPTGTPATPASALWNATNNPAIPGSGLATHGTCDPILTAETVGDPENVLPLGNQSAESSLAVANTYATHSFWRLSSNSSAGATVYYSGHTLSNTEGDQIAPIGATMAAAHPGTEQFGLALANTDGQNDTSSGGNNNTGYPVDYAQVTNYENGADNGLTAVDPSVATDLSGNGSYHAPQLAPLVPTANYGGGAMDSSNGGLPTDYAFDPTSDTVPVPIASEDTSVVNCVTGKMRYIANIAATTPAGIYTTKVNYIAAPQY